MMMLTGNQGEGGISATDWPAGCLGYALNLVRPKRPGQRASLVYNLLGSVLVFETLEQAAAYRELVTQVRMLLPGNTLLLEALQPPGLGQHLSLL